MSKPYLKVSVSIKIRLSFISFNILLSKSSSREIKPKTTLYQLIYVNDK